MRGSHVPLEEGEKDYFFLLKHNQKDSQKCHGDDDDDGSNDNNHSESSANSGYEEDGIYSSSASCLTPSEKESTFGRESVRRRRRLWQCLVVRCSNDLVHGSWWFVLASVVATTMAFIPLLGQVSHDFILGQFYECWIWLVVSGVFYTIGSYAFVRAFEEPPIPPLCNSFIFQNDELLGAWMFFFGTVPYIPYFYIYLVHSSRSILNLGGLIAACIGTFGCFVFVVSCFPSSSTQGRKKDYLRVIAQKVLGKHHWLIEHVQSDWLAGTWAVFIASTEWFIISFILLLRSFFFGHNDMDIVMFSARLLDALLFSIGAAYFVVGSYPEDSYSCYRAVSKEEKAIQERELRAMEPHEIDMQTGSIDESL